MSWVVPAVAGAGARWAIVVALEAVAPVFGEERPGESRQPVQQEKRAWRVRPVPQGLPVQQVPRVLLEAGRNVLPLEEPPREEGKASRGRPHRHPVLMHPLLLPEVRKPRSRFDGSPGW